MIVGGGIVGLSVAAELARRYPRRRLLLVEKEARWAAHQTGHNSGVIHSGIYYRPGSLKARFAIEGNRRLIAFCEQHGLPYDICGKVIVATDSAELPRLDALLQRGLDNGLAVRRVAGAELRSLEPHVRGVAAIHVPSAGIVDYARVSEALAAEAEAQGAELRRGVVALRCSQQADAVTLETAGGAFSGRFVVNCAGLHSDRVAAIFGAPVDAKIVPFRGEYYELSASRRYLVNNLIYPVPDPQFPFLGVHFTRMIDGSIHAGPNAVLSLKREGYRKRDINLRDTADTLSYAGFWRLAMRHWRAGGAEVARSFSKALFVRSLRRLIPEIRAADLVPAGAGVRAQALTGRGTLVEDFLLVEGTRSLHVCNAPSPAATASLPIGSYVADRVAQLMSE